MAFSSWPINSTVINCLWQPNVNMHLVQDSKANGQMSMKIRARTCTAWCLQTSHQDIFKKNKAKPHIFKYRCTQKYGS